MKQGSRGEAEFDLDLVRKAQAIEWLLLDVDGVLTDGHLFFSLFLFRKRQNQGEGAARTVGVVLTD